MSILASSFSVIAFSTGAAIVSFFLIRHTYRYLAQQRREEGNAMPERVARGDPGHNQRADMLSAEVARCQVQLHEISRDMMGELDTKMSALQALIRLADESTARLESAIHRAERLAACKPSESSEPENT
jgi:hypothetical protein